MILRSLASILLAASALTSAGCPKAFNDTDSATGSASSTTGEASTGNAMTSSGTTADETGTPTTGPTSTGMTEAGTTGTTAEGTTAEGTTAEGTTAAGTTGTGTTAEGTTAEGTTTGGISQLEASCNAACGTFLKCDPESYPDQASCVAECLDAATNGPECESAAAGFNNCIAGFNCKQLADAVDNGEFGQCTAAFEDYAGTCAP